MPCRHTISQGRAGEDGSWCRACGEKVLDVDPRECRNCSHYSALLTGPICRQHLMRVTPDMHVTYRIAEGTCFKPAAEQAVPTGVRQ